MGLRRGLNPEITATAIRFGWDAQWEHEQGLEPEVTLDTARWLRVGLYRVLVLGREDRYSADVLARIWSREGGFSGLPWVLWSEEAVTVWFPNAILADRVEKAIADGRAHLTVEPRLRNGQLLRGPGEPVLSWSPDIALVEST